MTDCPFCGQSSHKKRPCIPVAQRDPALSDATICGTCNLTFDGDHPTFLGGSEDRQHVTCEYCARIPERLLPDDDGADWNGLYGPGQRAWMAHCLTKRHRVAGRISGIFMARMLERIPIVLDHYSSLSKARSEGHTVIFDLAAENSA